MSAHVPALPLELDPLIAEAKQRARRRRVIAAVALTVTGAAVWGALAFGGGGSSDEIPWLPTRPQLGSANPPLAPACGASRLRATLSLQGATGNLAGGISIRNQSSQPCSLVGRPRLAFVGATSKWRVTRWQDQGPFDPLAPPLGSLRALGPGKWVSIPWLSYAVVLTNHSRHSFRFGRTCPAYTEQIDAYRAQAYILNCHSLGSIAPHASVRFAMRIHVPRNLSPKHPAVLGWTLAPHTWNAPQAVPVVLDVSR